MYFKTEGVILKRRNFGEADRLLTIYTRDFGKVTAIAHGVRRPRSKKAGHIELGNWCRVFIARGKNIDLLTEVELKKSFGVVDFTEDKANKIYHLLEIVDKLTVEHHKNQQVFSLLVHYLKRIAQADDFDLVSSTFKVKLLTNLGFFSTKQLAASSTKNVLEILEQDDFEYIKEKIKLPASSHLKLLAFLDRIIENITDSQLKTSRFLNQAVVQVETII